MFSQNYPPNCHGGQQAFYYFFSGEQLKSMGVRTGLIKRKQEAA